MSIILLTLLSFFLLFFLSRKLTASLYYLIHLITGSRKLALFILTSFLLPGTFIHEGAHWLMARILWVKTAGFTVIPQTDDHQSIRAGSVTVAKSDLIRGSLIGLAPIIIGLILLTLLANFLLSTIVTVDDLWHFLARPTLPPLVVFLALFEIGNTLFTSQSDLKDVTRLAILLTILGALLYILGLNISFSLPQSLMTLAKPWLIALAAGLITAAFVDLILVACLKLMIFLVGKLRG